MRPVAKIVVEKVGNSWLAWITGAKNIAFGGRTPRQAIARLLINYSDRHFDISEIKPIRSVSSDPMREFIIPIRTRRKTPATSLN